MVRRHPRCRPGYRARHPGCRPGSRARHPGWRPRQPGCRPPAPEVLVTGTRSWQPRMPRAAPGVPRPAAGFSPPRKFGQPGCRARHPGCRGPAAVSGEMRWRFTSRPYLERISVAISSSPHQARGQRGKFGVPRRHPGSAGARHPGRAGAAPGAGTRGGRRGTRGARTILKESWQAAWTVHRELRSCPRAGCIPRRGSRGDRYAKLLIVSAFAPELRAGAVLVSVQSTACRPTPPLSVRG